MCIAFGTALALKFRSAEQLRRRRLHQQNDSQFDKPFSTRPGNLPIKDKISLPLGVGDLDDIYDDKNPDVVPYNEGKLSFSTLLFLTNVFGPFIVAVKLLINTNFIMFGLFVSFELILILVRVQFHRLKWLCYGLCVNCAKI